MLRPVPRADWVRVLGSAALALVLLGSYMELRLALRGFRPSVTNSGELWVQERARASQLGPRALILIGASRMEVDIDTALLRRISGLEPVQLAIDGATFVPVLEGLERDPAVTGTIVADLYETAVMGYDPRSTAVSWQAAYDERSRQALPNFDSVESRLSGAWRAHLRSYADGATPLLSLVSRILPAHATQQYLVTLPDRSVVADYAKLPMPDFYYGRVLRNLGEDVPAPPGTLVKDLDAELRRRIGALKPNLDQLPAFERGVERMLADVRAIEARGGHVLFVAMPRSGLVREMDERRYPRETFWDPFAARAGTLTVHYADIADWNALQCPDGSHLDLRQRGAFTRSFAKVLGLEKK